MENQNPEVQAQQQSQPIVITLADLDLLRQILDLAASRGAFKGAELSEVGAVYNKLNEFLNLAASQIQAEQEQANSAQSQENQEQQTNETTTQQGE